MTIRPSIAAEPILQTILQITAQGGLIVNRRKGKCRTMGFLLTIFELKLHENAKKYCGVHQ
jgi:hypothetical protein